MPTYNEAESLSRLAEALFSLGLPNLILVIVDDNSPDGTSSIARRLSESYEGRILVIDRPRKMGLGTAYKDGFAKALHEGALHIVQMDADFSHPPKEIPAMLKKLDSADVVIGSRYTNNTAADERTALGRKLLSAWANGAIRIVTGLQVRDTTSGFKAFRREALEALDWSSFKSNGFAFQAEVAHACQRKGMQLVEHPFVFSDRIAGHSKMTWSIIAEAVLRLSLLRFKNS